MGGEIDLVIVGAGPAGMAAAVEAAGHKLSVLVLDEQPEEGGQIYRSVSTTERLRPESYTLLGDDYQKGKNLFRQIFGNTPITADECQHYSENNIICN